MSLTIHNHCHVDEDAEIERILYDLSNRGQLIAGRTAGLDAFRSIIDLIHDPMTRFKTTFSRSELTLYELSLLSPRRQCHTVAILQRMRRFLDRQDVGRLFQTFVRSTYTEHSEEILKELRFQGADVNMLMQPAVTRIGCPTACDFLVRRGDLHETDFYKLLVRYGGHPSLPLPRAWGLFNFFWRPERYHELSHSMKQVVRTLFLLRQAGATGLGDTPRELMYIYIDLYVSFTVLDFVAMAESSRRPVESPTPRLDLSDVFTHG